MANSEHLNEMIDHSFDRFTRDVWRGKQGRLGFPCDPQAEAEFTVYAGVHDEISPSEIILTTRKHSTHPSVFYPSLYPVSKSEQSNRNSFPVYDTQKN